MWSRPPRPRARLAGDGAAALAIASAVLVLLVMTGPDFGMVWDEASTVRREQVLDGWFHGRAGAPRRPAFSAAALEHSWPFSREEPDGHPPFYALLGLAGWHLSRGFLSPPASYRFGPMALTAATAGLLYLHLAGRRGRLAATTASFLFLLMPRTFAHAHYAHYDMPVTCLWLLSQVAFVEALRSPRWAVPFGLLLGLAAGTKFTGWFAPVAPLCWVAAAEGLPGLRPSRRDLPAREASRRRPGSVALAIGLPLAALTLIAIQPPWWHDPWKGVVRLVTSNLTRQQTNPLPVTYLGERYMFSLPWHNTLVWTAVTVPALVLALGALGIVGCIARRREDPSALIWPLSWGVLMVVRALPNAPGHDGIRLFLPSIATLPVLAGLGAVWLADVSRARLRVWVAVLAAAGALAESLAGIAQTYPYTDSYYSMAIGGLPGARRLGFDPTYYWETMSGPEFLDWVRRESLRGPVELRLASDPLEVYAYLRQWDLLPRGVRIAGLDPTLAAYYVVQCRPSTAISIDRWLERHGRPCFQGTASGSRPAASLSVPRILAGLPGDQGPASMKRVIAARRADLVAIDDI